MTDEDNGDIHRFQHDFEGRSQLSTTVIIALEDVADIEGPASPVLADVIDPDALDNLFRPIQFRTDRDTGHVTFPIGDYHVTIHADGEIVIRAAPAPE